jgi:hypothetical protein
MRSTLSHFEFLPRQRWRPCGGGRTWRCGENGVSVQILTKFRSGCRVPGHCEKCLPHRRLLGLRLRLIAPAAARVARRNLSHPIVFQSKRIRRGWTLERRNRNAEARRPQRGARRAWLLASGFWLLASGFWLLASGFWLLASGFWLLALGLAVGNRRHGAEIALDSVDSVPSVVKILLTTDGHGLGGGLGGQWAANGEGGVA